MVKLGTHLELLHETVCLRFHHLDSEVVKHILKMETQWQDPFPGPLNLQQKMLEASQYWESCCNWTVTYM